MSQNEYEMLLDLVKRRRTVRKFKPNPLPDNCIEKIIEVARWAPSGFHTHNVDKMASFWTEDRESAPA